MLIRDKVGTGLDWRLGRTDLDFIPIPTFTGDTNTCSLESLEDYLLFAGWFSNNLIYINQDFN